MGVGVVLPDPVGVLVNQAVEHERRLPQLAVDDVHPELASLVGDVAVDTHAPAHAEGPGEVARLQDRGGDAKAHPVRRRGRSRTEGGRERQRAVVVEERGDGPPQGLFAEAPVVHPHELASSQQSRCPQLQRPAATGRRRYPFITARSDGASWRSVSQLHTWFGPVARSSGLA